jgi:regulator of protease activity HflC (stomatin/prohibitin superfamily)
MKTVTIFQHHVGLHFHKGCLKQTLMPGRYRFWGSGDTVLPVSVMPNSRIVPTRDIMTSDGALVKVRLLIETKVVNAEAAYAANFLPRPRGSDLLALLEEQNTVTTDFEVALFKWVSGRTLEAVMAGYQNVSAELKEQLQAGYLAKGIELGSVDVLDFTLSGPLRQAMSELLKVDIDAKVALGRARAEAATMRSLLNTARLVREHPKLLEIRMLATGQKPKVTFLVSDSSAGSPSSEAALDETLE